MRRTRPVLEVSLHSFLLSLSLVIDHWSLVIGHWSFHRCRSFPALWPSASRVARGHSLSCVPLQSRPTPINNIGTSALNGARADLRAPASGHVYLIYTSFTPCDGGGEAATPYGYAVSRASPSRRAPRGPALSVRGSPTRGEISHTCGPRGKIAN